MKNQVRLTKENVGAIEQLKREAKLDLLTFPKAANMAIEKGLPAVRKLFVKPAKK
jgi:hypothetical protein